MLSSEGFSGVRAFVLAVEAGSFAAAGRRLGLTPSSIGKAVSRLERRLDVRLFQRTTRSLSLTDEGLAFHESCVRALGELDRAESALAERRVLPSGRLRLALPVLFGRERIVPLLLRLAERYPALEIEALFSNRAMDFAEDGIDLAVRIGVLEDSGSLCARKLGVQRLAVCAAPAYLTDHAAPGAPEDLREHACIGMLRDGRVEPWRFLGNAGAYRSVSIAARLRFDQLEAVVAAAKAGHGLAQLPEWLVADALRRGELVSLLPAHQGDGLPIHALWPASRTMTARLRVLIDALRDEPSLDSR